MQQYVYVRALVRHSGRVSCYTLAQCLHSPTRSVRTVHSALCTRVLLNLRKAAASASNSRPDGLTTMATLALESLPMFAPHSDEDLEGEDAI